MSMSEEWESKTLEKLAIVERGRFSARPRNDPQYYGGSMPFIQTGDVSSADGALRTWTQTLNAKGVAVSKVFPRGTIFYNDRRKYRRQSAISTFDAVCPDSVVAIRNRPGVDRGWLFQSLQLKKKVLDSYATQNAQKNINLEILRPLVFNTPPLAEQKRIVEILRVWDNAIDRNVRLLALVQKRFRSIQQELFGVAAVKKSAWSTAPLGRITDRVRRKNDGGQHPVMTISGKSGFLRQDERFSRFMAGDSLENYVLLMEGEFSYNKGNSYTYPQGCIYRLQQPSALVPNVYISFRLRRDLNADFYAALFLAGFLNRQLARLINSGVRNNGLLNLNPEDFFSCEVPIPPHQEQLNIADFMRTAAQQNAALEKAIALLRQQKRSLMQKLLTGEWRAPVHDGDMETVATSVCEETVQ